MTLLTELLVLRDTRFEECIELLLKNIEAQISLQPYLSAVSLNIATVIGFNDSLTNEKLIEILIEGGLNVILNVGLMNTTFDFNLSNIDKPLKSFDKRLYDYRIVQLNKLQKLVFDEVKKQISTLPSIKNIFIDVYKVTGISNQETTDYIVQKFKEGGLDAKSQYNTIQINLPDLSYKRPRYILNNEEKKVLEILSTNQEIEHKIEHKIQAFLLAILNYLETNSDQLIRHSLTYSNVYIFTQSLSCEPITSFLRDHNINIDNYKCDKLEQIPCSLEEWRHCDDFHYIIKSIGNDNEFKLAFPLFNYILTQI